MNHSAGRANSSERGFWPRPFHFGVDAVGQRQQQVGRRSNETGFTLQIHKSNDTARCSLIEITQDAAFAHTAMTVQNDTVRVFLGVPDFIDARKDIAATHEERGHDRIACDVGIGKRFCGALPYAGREID